MRELRASQLAATVEHLSHRPDQSELIRAWDELLMDTKSNADFEPLVQAIMAIHLARPEHREALRDVVVRLVKNLNDFAELIDSDLLDWKDFVRAHPPLFRRLLVELTLLAPVIWYESLVLAKGRWGYRILRLNDLALAHRTVREVEDTRAAIRVFADARPEFDLPRISAPQYVLSRIRLAFTRPTISSRTKVAQQRQANRLRQHLQDAGLPTPDRDRLGRATEW